MQFKVIVAMYSSWKHLLWWSCLATGVHGNCTCQDSCLVLLLKCENENGHIFTDRQVGVVSDYMHQFQPTNAIRAENIARKCILLSVGNKEYAVPLPNSLETDWVRSKCRCQEIFLFVDNFLQLVSNGIQRYTIGSFFVRDAEVWPCFIQEPS